MILTDFMPVFEVFSRRIGLKMMDQIELGRRLSRFDTDFSGGLDGEEFVKLYKNLLQDVVGERSCVLCEPRRERSRSRPCSVQLQQLPSDPRKESLSSPMV